MDQGSFQISGFLKKKCPFIPVSIKAAVCCKEQPLCSLFFTCFLSVVSFFR